ncbi:MAG: type II toxin-antitoxin system VapC family toxin [Niveispirillum sp.]|nr:type II toxin-antitoxin system VapC family toxin [Niveispirillum sp.]
MFVLDTNVISELMRPAGSDRVFNWISRQSPALLFTTSVTQAEIFFGLSIMPDGRRKDLLMKAAQTMFVQDFAERILPFDMASSLVYADIRSRRQQTGAPISVFDAQIAAITKLYSATLVTRNIPDFRDCDITLINPWTDD